MKNRFKILSAGICGLVLFLSSCSTDDDSVILPPQIGLSPEEQELQLFVGDSLEFKAINENNSEYTEAWTLNDSVVANNDTYLFEPESPGTYSLTYEASNAAGSFKYKYQLHVEVRIRPITEESSAYVSELLEFLPAPGQFINKNPGNLESAENVVGGNTGLVSLGAWGGSITFAFDHTVINREDEMDLIIYGNPLPNFSEPGVVYVMQDVNGNGLPDDTWYEIKGSGHNLEGTLRDYEVTYFRPEAASDDVAWEDNLGNTGAVETNAFHKQAYYPEWITEDSYTLSGTLLPANNIDMSNPSYITSMPFEYGYADNLVGGDKIDLADAIDAAGNPANLSGIDFIKIQTGILANAGWLGEISTEIRGVADLSLIEQ